MMTKVKSLDLTIVVLTKVPIHTLGGKGLAQLQLEADLGLQILRTILAVSTMTQLMIWTQPLRSEGELGPLVASEEDFKIRILTSMEYLIWAFKLKALSGEDLRLEG